MLNNKILKELISVTQQHVNLREVAVEQTCLITQYTPRPHYTLDELLAQSNSSADTSMEDRAWLDNTPVGCELL